MIEKRLRKCSAPGCRCWTPEVLCSAHRRAAAIARLQPPPENAASAILASPGRRLPCVLNAPTPVRFPIVACTCGNAHE